MRNFNKIDDFFEFITEAGDAVLTLCADPWFTSDSGSTGSFLRFFCRQKDNMIRIAAAGEAMTEEEYRKTCTPGELSEKVTAILSQKSVRDFFGLSAPTECAPQTVVSLTQSSCAEENCTARD